jgi:hypothetical protein
VPNLRTLATRVNGKAPAPITAVIEADSNREDSNRGNISKEELKQNGVESEKPLNSNTMKRPALGGGFLKISLVFGKAFDFKT